MVFAPGRSVPPGPGADANPINLIGEALGRPGRRQQWDPGARADPSPGSGQGGTVPPGPRLSGNWRGQPSPAGSAAGRGSGHPRGLNRSSRGCRRRYEGVGHWGVADRGCLAMQGRVLGCAEEWGEFGGRE